MKGLQVCIKSEYRFDGDEFYGSNILNKTTVPNYCSKCGTVHHNMHSFIQVVGASPSLSLGGPPNCAGQLSKTSTKGRIGLRWFPDTLSWRGADCKGEIGNNGPDNIICSALLARNLYT
jgi:hypothetical protein